MEEVDDGLNYIPSMKDVPPTPEEILLGLFIYLNLTRLDFLSLAGTAMLHGCPNKDTVRRILDNLVVEGVLFHENTDGADYFILPDPGPIQ